MVSSSGKYGRIRKYHKYPKSLYTKLSDKMAYANSADLDQIRSSLISFALFAIPLSILGNNYI